MKIIIYCQCNGCADSTSMKRDAELSWLPRVGEVVDGAYVRRVSHSSATGQVTVFTSNVEDQAAYPDSAKWFRHLMVQHGYSECPHDEWFSAYFS
jgi:hypothetical protein